MLQHTPLSVQRTITHAQILTTVFQHDTSVMESCIVPVVLMSYFVASIHI